MNFAPGAPERVAKRDCAAVDVYFSWSRLRARMIARVCAQKSFVQFDEVDGSASFESGEVERLGDRGDGADAHLFRQAAAVTA